MSVPPFPSQDLAKLVLGYLAEEQLMTAYDEFLQASPYLDALRNEYDRIFMTSLRNILAEYRAVKIFVETCKPFTLRRKLFQCSNLLEVVKFLVHHIDIDKISPEPTSDRNSSSKCNNEVDAKQSGCAMCFSLNLGSCTCRSSLTSSNLLITSQDNNTCKSSVETTPLEDLPGNHVPLKKKQVKTLEKESKASPPTTNLSISDDITEGIEGNLETNINSFLGKSVKESNALLNNEKCSMAVVTTQNYSSEVNIVCTETDHNRRQTNHVVNTSINKLSATGTFHEFANGVCGNTSTLPDSSTSEILTVHTLTKETSVSRKPNVYSNKNKGHTKAHILLKVQSNKNEDEDKQAGSYSCVKTVAPLKSKPNDKIKILSDVKVDKVFKSCDTSNTKMPSVLKNATSTPMTRILINGNPVYDHKPTVGLSCDNYTKDEIMAMPTIIVVPASAPVTNPVNTTSRSFDSASTALTGASSVQSLEPLVIDVPPESPIPEERTSSGIVHMPDISFQQTTEPKSLVTLDIKNCSLPKDNPAIGKMGTPHMLPPKRKSSSTPRRSSHVRVLDFTTPRRILQETINEQITDEKYKSPVEVIISRSPNLHSFVDDTNEKKINNALNIDSNDTTEISKSDNKIVPHKNHGWDADLRALVGSYDPCKAVPPASAKKSRKKKVTDETTLGAKNTAKKRKGGKTKRKCEENVRDSKVESKELPETNITVKPTINIITKPDLNTTSQKVEKTQNKSDEQINNTPEMERISLQNVIGAKLNISDLLETPYKQALYDIQMETPRFLGPDLPDVPLSDIKIMNIPTPRFLNTPKPVQATPSSYSSRPTDYSSGGSYYKPDDQEYIFAEDLGYPADSKKRKSDGKENVKEKRSSRPVRECTKNVSYYKSPVINPKNIQKDDKKDVVSSSETISFNSSSEIDKESSCKLSKQKSKTRPRGIAKANKVTKKPKTTTKKETAKTYIKIKPRKPMSPQGIIMKLKKSSEQNTKPSKQRSKENVDIDVTPAVSPGASPGASPAPAKSRRKSSTPRKIDCGTPINSSTTDINSYSTTLNIKEEPVTNPVVVCAQDSDTEQLALRWSDDGSQDAKSKEPPTITHTNESDDITKIKEYIQITQPSVYNYRETESTLHNDLVKKGFDSETAKNIERDLLDTPPDLENSTRRVIPHEENDIKEIDENKSKIVIEKGNDSDCSNSEQQTEEVVDVEFSTYECNEDNDNYIKMYYDEKEVDSTQPVVTLKDKFSIEFCIEDGVNIRIRATPFSLLLDQDPQETQSLDDGETQMAVNSIANIEKLYTPRKESMKAECYQIFDSTLTSLDTPLKVSSPKRSESETTIAEIVLEVEKIEERTDVQTRKRLLSPSDDSSNECKKSKPEAQYLLSTANIQNIDIESVLSRLHGP